jgi:hypothetical protein
MRTRLQRRARASEEVGKRIADEMKAVFVLHQQTAEQVANRRQVEAMVSLRTALYEAVEGFNDQAPWAYHLAVLNRGDRLIFNSFGQFTLTVTLGESHVMIHRTPECARSEVPLPEAPVIVNVVNVDGHTRYRAAAGSSALKGPVLTELQFVDSVIRLACNSHLSRRAAC